MPLQELNRQIVLWCMSIRTELKHQQMIPPAPPHSRHSRECFIREEKLHHVTVCVSNDCLLSFARWQGIKAAVKKGNKELPAANSHYLLHLPQDQSSQQQRGHSMWVKGSLSLVSSHQSLEAGSAAWVCGHSLLKPKLSYIKGRLKIDCFLFFCFFSLWFFASFGSASHLVCSCCVSVINLHQIRLL